MYIRKVAFIIMTNERMIIIIILTGRVPLLTTLQSEIDLSLRNILAVC